MSHRLRSSKRRAIKTALAARDGACCFYCGDAFGAELTGATIDHLIPYCRFRRNLQVNLVLACQPCNGAKAARMPHEFLRLSVTDLAARARLSATAVAGVLADPDQASKKARNRVLAALRTPPGVLVGARS